MRPTRLGLAVAALSAFGLFAAGSTGNNLLYLIFSATTVSLAVAAVYGRHNLRGLTAVLESPERAERGAPARARAVVRNGGGWTARLVRAAGPRGATAPADLAPGAAMTADLSLALQHRGLNRVDGVFLESRHPFGLFVHRRRLPPADLLALPRAGGRAADEPPPAPDPRARADGGRNPHREGDFFGPRPYGPDDDARLIHWKLSAKTGRPVVLEYASAPRGRVIVKLESADDEAAEAAAAACARRVAEGAEVGLVGPGVEVEPARGPVQLDRLLRALALAGEGGTPRPAPAAPPPRDEGAQDSPALRRLTLLGGVLVYASLFLIDDLSPRGLLWFAPLVPLGFWLRERGGPFPPAPLWNAASFAALVYLVGFDWRISGVALANAHLLGYLLVNRLFSPWTAGELRQAMLILYLSFFLIAGLTISPWFFPLFVAWVAFSGAWLSLQAGAAPARWRGWLPELGRLTLAGALAGTLLFMVIPRVEGLRRFNPFVASGMDKLQINSDAVMGFTDRVTLGTFGTLRRSSARALRLRPLHPPPSGEAPPVYVRGAAFDVFDGRTWGKTPSGVPAPGARAGGTWTFPGAGRAADGWDFEVYPMQVSVVFTVGAPAELDGLPGGGWYDRTDSVYASEPLTRGARYRERQAPAGLQPSGPPSEEELALALRTTLDPDGREAALAARWTAGAAGPAEKADAIAAALRREYSYSTHSDGRGSGLRDFLFRSRSGNCEYFASAAAILLRRAGVPTRLVTGFHADEWNRWGRFYDVRQSQAHAWVEAWIPGRGWTTVDATPGESGFSAAADELSRRLSLWADAFQTRWYRSVIGYDQYSQRDAFLRMTMAGAFESLRSALEKLLKDAAPAAAAAGLLLWALAAARPLLKRSDEYERAERLLARAGLRRREWQTPREFAREVAAARPELAPLRDLAEAHYRRRWGGADPSAAERACAAELLLALKAGLRAPRAPARSN